MNSRREYLKTVLGIGGVSVLAGCTADESDSQDQDKDSVKTNSQKDNSVESDVQGTTDEQTDPIDPRVTAIQHPDPRMVSMHEESISGNRYEFFVEIENTGISGDVGYTLFWLENSESEPGGLGSEPVVTQARYYQEGERREVSITANMPENRRRYGFVVWTTEVTVEIENRGGEGRAEVVLMDGNTVIKDIEIMMSSGENIVHTWNDIERESLSSDSNIYAEANPIV